MFRLNFFTLFPTLFFALSRAHYTNEPPHYATVPSPPPSPSYRTYNPAPINTPIPSYQIYPTNWPPQPSPSTTGCVRPCSVPCVCSPTNGTPKLSKLCPTRLFILAHFVMFALIVG
ncbi:hypothetical protein niasHS_017806 [Heterodera schachtii]|uniref:Uncharacterized protein n=2 Tax=Heterodera TaxID=34509 RepID=A0ABD2HY39_HETSC